MIFTFSGTGNSLYAAGQLAEPGETVIDMARCCREKTFTFTPGEAERVGFVFPVYCGGVPSPVRYFARRLVLTEEPAYVWAVITCGARIFAAGEMLRDLLADSGVILDAVFPLKMPDNCVTLYELPPEEVQLQTLEDAEKELRVLKERIRVHELPDDAPTLADRAATAAMYPAYANMRSVRKFRADDSCVGCGVCAGRCPTKVIEMIDGRPHWVHDRCARCMACLRCNAVQYGTKTVGRTRWVNPVLRKKHHQTVSAETEK